MPLPLLTMYSKEKQRLQMIEAALKDKAPKTYRALKSQKTLQSFLKDHDKAMLESYDQAIAEAWPKILNPSNPNKYVEPELAMAAHQAWEETMSVWLEFSDQDERTTDE